MRQIAFISDIHGNAVALAAVLADIGRRRVDEIVCLGDVAAGGPQFLDGKGPTRPSCAAPEQEHRISELRHYVPADLLDVSFPVSVRGYDRGAVDAYITTSIA